jgi:hypothetical protein
MRGTILGLTCLAAIARSTSVGGPLEKGPRQESAQPSPGEETPGDGTSTSAASAAAGADKGAETPELTHHYTNDYSSLGAQFGANYWGNSPSTSYNYQYGNVRDYSNMFSGMGTGWQRDTNTPQTPFQPQPVVPPQRRYRQTQPGFGESWGSPGTQVGGGWNGQQWANQGNAYANRYESEWNQEPGALNGQQWANQGNAYANRHESEWSQEPGALVWSRLVVVTVDSSSRRAFLTHHPSS